MPMVSPVSMNKFAEAGIVSERAQSLQFAERDDERRVLRSQQMFLERITDGFACHELYPVGVDVLIRSTREVGAQSMTDLTVHPRG